MGNAFEQRIQRSESPNQKTSSRGFFSLVIALAVLLSAACAHPPAPAAVETPQHARYNAPYNGPKVTIAVARFDSIGIYAARYGGADIGGGLSAMLASELAMSDRFILVERGELGSVLREQEMALGGLTTAETSPRAGQLLGARLLVRGSVTEFSEGDEGGGLSVGVPMGGGFAGALSARGQVGHVTIDLRVIDTTTGRVVATRRVERRLTSRSVGFGGRSRSGFSFGSDRFQKSPVGKATREAIAEAVYFVEGAAQQASYASR